MAKTNPLISIPNLPSGTEPAIAAAFQSLVDQLNNLKVLVASPISTADVRGIVGAAVGAAVPDYDIPPAISGIRTLPAPGGILITWDRQIYASYAHAQVWRNTSGVLDGTEQMVGTAGSFVYTDLLTDQKGAEYFYWIKPVSNSSPPIVGEYNQLAGTSGLVGEIKGAQLGSGTLPADTILQLGDGIVLDGASGQILITQAGGITGNDYVILNNGEIQYMVWDGTQHINGKALRQIYSDTANSGDIVSIGPPGAPLFFKNQPIVTVSLNTLMAYSATYPLQDQQWEVSADNLREDPVGSGFWKFDAVCRLAFAAASGTTNATWVGSNTADGDVIYSSIHSTEALCVQFSPSITARSSEYSHSVDVVNYYYNKQVKWRVNYGLTSGLGSYTGWQTKALGSTFDDVADSMTLTGLAANKWYFATEYYFEDAGGTFSSGVSTYSYAEGTVANAGTSAEASAYEYGGTSTVNDSAALNLPAYSPPAGYTIYNVNYTAEVAYFLSLTDPSGSGQYGSASGPGLSAYRSAGGAEGVPFPTYINKAYSSGTFSIYMGVSVAAKGATGKATTVKARSRNVAATIQSRKLVTPTAGVTDNNAGLTQFTFQLTTASEISAGVIAYQAIGQ